MADHAVLGRWSTLYGAQQPFDLGLRVAPAPTISFTLFGLPVLEPSARLSFDGTALYL